MPLNPNKDLKLYYSIGEVAEMFGVSETLLRYWEKGGAPFLPKKWGGYCLVKSMPLSRKPVLAMTFFPGMNSRTSDTA